MPTPRKYPWDKWLKQPHTVLLRGIHYRCSQSTMCQIIRNNASARGLRVSLLDTETEITINVTSVGEYSAIPYADTPTIVGKHTNALEGSTELKKEATLDNVLLHAQPDTPIITTSHNHNKDRTA